MFSDCYRVSLSISSPPPPPNSSKVPYVIYLSLIDLCHPLVDHLGYYLSVCLIRHPLWSFVSWSSQDSTVQGSSPYKCGQKVSYRAFNAVTVAFPKISELPSLLYIHNARPY